MENDASPGAKMINDAVESLPIHNRNADKKAELAAIAERVIAELMGHFCVDVRGALEEKEATHSAWSISSSSSRSTPAVRPASFGGEVKFKQN